MELKNPIMSTIYGIVDVSHYYFKVHEKEIKRVYEIAAYSFIGFFTPFLFTHPQLLLGSIVNSMLVLGALYGKGKEIVPLIILPSLGVLARGILFGPFTIYLIYMLPFIWIGNSIIVLGMKYLYVKKRFNYGISAFICSSLKSLFLFISAYFLYSLHLVPPLFLIAFGIMQLFTALIGSFAIFPMHKLRKKK